MRPPSIQLTVAGLIVATSVAGAQTRAGSEAVSGRWSLAVRTAEGPDTRALDLVMTGDSSITGTVTSSLGSIAITGGRLDRDRLRFEFAMAGGEIRVTYDMVLRADTLRGVFRQNDYEGEVLGVRGDRVVRFPASDGGRGGARRDGPNALPDQRLPPVRRR